MPIKECCQKPENLSPPELTGAPQETMQRCKVCNCRHFRITVDPGRYTAKLGGIGRKEG